jgi:hypothetical protein
MPDLYLHELQERFYEDTGRKISRVTVYRALRRSGFTRKIVWFTVAIIFAALTYLLYRLRRQPENVMLKSALSTLHALHNTNPGSESMLTSPDLISAHPIEIVRGLSMGSRPLARSFSFVEKGM